METIIKQEPIRTVYTDGTIVISNVRDPRTNEMVSYTVRNTWYDGTPMNDTKVDSFGVFTKYRPTGEYVRKNLPNWGLSLLEVDTVAQLRSLDPYLLHLIKVGYYNGVKLNGYYTKNDTPKPLNYYVSTTSKADDGGSVFALGSVKIEHKFLYLFPEYFGAKGDGITDDTVALEKCFALLPSANGIDGHNKYRKTREIVLGSVESKIINITGNIINDNCNGVKGFYNKCYVKLNCTLANSPYLSTRTGLDIQGTKSTFDLKADTDNGTSQYGNALKLYNLEGNNFKFQVNGNRMGLTDADDNATVISKLKGTGVRLSYGINNTFNDCYAIYFDKGLEIPFETHPTASYANEGSMFINSRFLWCNNTTWINVGTGLEFTNCMLDISRKESLIINNVYRMAFNNCWISTVSGYAPWNVVIDNSRGVVFTNVMLGGGNANSMQVRNSERCIFNNIVCKYDTTLPITNNLIIESTCKDCVVDNILGINLINQSSTTRYNTRTKKAFNLNFTDNELGGNVSPNVPVINSFGSRTAPIDGELTNLLEVYSDSSNSLASNFQIGKTGKGLLVRHSGTGGWETKVISTYPASASRKGTTSERPTALHATKDIGFEYFDTTLIKPIWWKGSGWVDASGGAV